MREYTTMNFIKTLKRESKSDFPLYLAYIKMYTIIPRIQQEHLPLRQLYAWVMGIEAASAYSKCQIIKCKNRGQELNN